MRARSQSGGRSASILSAMFMREVMVSWKNVGSLSDSWEGSNIVAEGMSEAGICLWK